MIKKITGNERVLNWVVLVLLSLVWGTSFILIKKGLRDFSPEQVGSIRIAISAIAFLPFLRTRYKSISKSDIKFLLVVGLLGSGIPAFLFAAAQQEVSSAVAGLLNSLTPLFTLIFGIFIFKLPFKWSKLIGVLIGFLGASLLIYFGKATGAGSNLYYVGLIILATMCYAMSVNTLSSKLKHLSSLTISSASFAIMLIPFIAYTLYLDVPGTFMGSASAPESFMYIMILSLFGTFGATILFFKLVHRTDALFGSMVTYMIPIVALGWGFVDGEPVNYLHLVGMILILSGIYITKRKG